MLRLTYLIIIGLMNLETTTGNNFLSDFSRKNGFGILTIFRENDVSESDLKLIEKSFIQNNVAFWNAENLSDFRKMDNRILYLYKSNFTHLNDILTHSPIKGVIAVSFAEEKTFPVVEKMSHFYWLQGDYEVYHVIKIDGSDSMIINPLKLRDNIIVENPIDFRGTEMKVVTLEWAPYLIMNCSEGSEVCDCDGYLYDTLNIISRELNFTWLCIKEKNNHWGSQRNEKGEWTGTLGALVNKESNICLSTWIRTYDREKAFDFVEIATGNIAGCMFIGNKNADYELFFRPFTMPTWIVIGLISGSVWAYFISASIKVDNFFESGGFKTLITTLSYFFVLLNAYYGGAMTMFFSTEVTVPFETAMDVVFNPEWTNIFTTGDKLLVLQRLPVVHEKVKEYWEQVDENPEYHIVSDVLEGLRRAKKDRVVFFRDMTSIFWKVSSSNAYQLEFQGMTFIEKQGVFYNCLLQKNSPLRDPMRLLYLGLQERGVQDKLFKNWVQVSYSNPAVELFTLTEGQMSALFLWLAAGMVIALTIFAIELLYKNGYKRKSKRSNLVSKPIILYKYTK